MITQVMQYLKDKTVAIVGNAQSIFDKKDGVNIEQHDVIIRFNKGFVTEPIAQGVRTDILILACELSPEELAYFGAKYTINRTKKTKCGDYTFGFNFRFQLKKIIGAYPTSGFMVIDLCRKAGASKIDLYGFDFEATPTFYNPKNYKTKHNYEIEKRLIHLLAGQGVLTIN